MGMRIGMGTPFSLLTFNREATGEHNGSPEILSPSSFTGTSHMFSNQMTI